MAGPAEKFNTNQPLVTIGMPTYNREHLLRRALDSALAQTYQNIEIQISDNASTDGTQRLCEEYARTDSRVIYCRQETNIGPSSNISNLMRQARGQFYLCLADDDWLEPTYVEYCVAELLEHEDVCLVAGKANYYRDDSLVTVGEIIDLVSPSPSERVLGFYASVQLNGVFYGVSRADRIAQGYARPRVLGEDWFFTAGMACTGKIRTLQTTTIFRSLRGSGETWDELCSSAGYGSGKHWPFLAISWAAAQDVLVYNKAYGSMPAVQRSALAARVFMSLYVRFGLRELWRNTLVGPLVRDRVVRPFKRSAFAKAIRSAVRR